MTVISVLLQLASITGYGLILFRILNLDQDLHGPLKVALSIAVGMGLLGWLIFPVGIAGYLNSNFLIVILLVGLAGLLYLKNSNWPKLTAPNPLTYGLIALVVLAMGMDLIEALTPPADADSLAYHYRVPRQFIDSGRITFIDRAFDGAVPLLLHMSYIPVLAIGGEMAMTIWMMISGWTVCLLLYLLCRLYLNQNWSLAVAIIYLTTPAVVFAGGSGHIESRIGIFVLLVAWAVSRSIETGNNRYIILAGFGAGFYAGAKYLGLFLALAAGLTLIMRRDWFIRGLIYSGIALVAGFQWYYWNAVNTGDPFFPMLFEWLGSNNLEWWPKAHHQIKKEIFLHTEKAVPQNILWMIYYPILATLDSAPIFESRRTGFGPYGLLVLPFFMFGLWKFRSRLLAHPLFIYGAIACLFYMLWFLWGPSQRIRHLLPIYPLFLICSAIVTARIANQLSWRQPLIAGLGLTILLQIGGHGFFTLKFARYLGSNETRQEYLKRNVVNYNPIPWINANLKKSDKILLTERQLFYYLKIPFFFASDKSQGAINLDQGQTDANIFYQQIKSQGITHLLAERISTAVDSPYHLPYEILNKAGCLERVQSFDAKRFASRTLPRKSVSGISIYDVVRLKGQSCLE